MSKISTEFTAAPWNAVSTFGVLDQHPWGTVMDRNNRIGRRGRRERCEILKITQGQGEGVLAVDKGQLGPLRPNTILEALEEASHVVIVKVIFGRPSSNSFGLDAAATGGCKPRPHQLRFVP